MTVTIKRLNMFAATSGWMSTMRPEADGLSGRTRKPAKLAVAGAMLKMVKPNDPYYPEAKALEGVLLSLQDQHGNALAPLQIALATGGRAQRGEVFKATVTLNLARAYYAAGNFGQAAHYWSQIQRDDPKWLDAQFERAWAHFPWKTDGTLGLLQNHISPYFQDVTTRKHSAAPVLFLLAGPEAGNGAFQPVSTPTKDLQGDH